MTGAAIRFRTSCIRTVFSSASSMSVAATTGSTTGFFFGLSPNVLPEPASKVRDKLFVGRDPLFGDEDVRVVADDVEGRLPAAFDVSARAASPDGRAAAGRLLGRLLCLLLPHLLHGGFLPLPL